MKQINNMRKLIEMEQKNLIVCDNPDCDYTFPYSGESEKLLLAFVNVPCPKCGQNLLTPEDYLMAELLKKSVDRINKRFSWLTLFMPRKKSYPLTSVHVHNGIHFSHSESDE